MTARPLDRHLALLAIAGILLLTLVGAGLYAVAPLAGSDEDSRGAKEQAVRAVESYVEAWAEQRCEDAADRMDGPRAEILAACHGDAVTDSLVITSSQVELDGDRGTAHLEVRYREEGKDRVRDVVEELVRVDGTWKVAWRP